MTTSWTITLEEDPDTGDLMLQLPEDFLKNAGWHDGDTISWVDNADGTWSLQKKENVPDGN
jgi:hypothetical protein